jgi:Fe-S oxidoreductase
VKPIMREGSPVTDDVLWSCTTCRACEDICPVNIEHLDFIVEVRKHQVLMEASFPPEVQETFTNLENQANPWGFGADSRADWCKGMDVPLDGRPPRGRPALVRGLCRFLSTTGARRFPRPWRGCCSVPG